MKKIMFNDKYSLTQAILEGRKTMTRRICKEQIRRSVFCESGFETIHGYEVKPKYEIGEVVAIAQSYSDVDQFHRKGESAAYLEYLVSMLPELKLYPGWGNKMFVKADLMPRHIKITRIKVERLQDISDEDCLKEGIVKQEVISDESPLIYAYDAFLNGESGYFASQWFKSPKEAFAVLIDKVSGKGTWESNPFVFCYSFKLLR